MMVIRGTSNAGNGTAGVKIHPADRCTWTYNDPAYVNGQYQIDDAWYTPGTGADLAITNPELGYIGKSGRFVRIAE